MDDLDMPIRYMEQLSGEEQRRLHKITKSCSEANYCLNCCVQKCAVADFLQLLSKKASKERILKFLHNASDEKKDELRDKPLYCMEQGFCALYCISDCPIGKFVRALTRERALGRDNTSDLYSNVIS
ncbi:MAG: hypothetical protein IBX64_01155 [Actinobacteria bacterium]|nr:hypothetical protein [Actinomycetota bacterium]